LRDKGEFGIRESQIILHGTEKCIALAELIRVFGEPKNQPRTNTAVVPITPQAVAISDESNLITLLREQIVTAERRE
jgi:hypothetical protein